MLRVLRINRLHNILVELHKLDVSLLSVYQAPVQASEAAQVLHLQHHLLVFVPVTDKDVVHVAVLVQLVATRKVLDLFRLELYAQTNVLHVHTH